eukprot:CAMPEP_0174381474 /NCGR_PEP_ID=MMETSP0811_2-20130205/124038_1 /TAXON_ID=73025 ORGANISM="Eutreptiella gymnastica-like, Strain CCMP1594" /NCGR_SAMPLE_ID=MMETSP0811_2 /ASSEMBLY_ACC=CAM_ASM_000667 /LENGTH=78 /DNA_ID=CAMNT_0015534629 /DNA_START=1127 /DNA_END=1360 /DNA_ORIENTATION=-
MNSITSCSVQEGLCPVMGLHKEISRVLTNQQSRAQANPVGPRQKAAPGLPSELPNSAVNSMGGLANGNWAQRRFTVLV